jgi:hypothetical protein
MTLADRHGMRNVLLAALVFSGSVGCIGDIIEGKPSTGGNGNADMAQAPSGGGGSGGSTGGSAGTGGAGSGGGVDAGSGGSTGGGAVTFTQIQADAEMKGCTVPGACHGPGAANKPSWIKNGDTGYSLDANYTSVKGEIDAGNDADSKLLKHLLPGGGHGGGVEFPSTDDPVYQRWLAWIQAGANK